MPASPRWMLVCKPLRAPFHDGSTVLVRDLVNALPASRPLTYLGDPTYPLRDAADDEIIAAAPMGHAPSFFAKAGVLTHLLDRRRFQQPVHFFFTPNRITSSVLGGVRRLASRRRLVQSLMSSHGVAGWADLLRPLDRVVVLSDHTRHRLIEAGVAEQRVVRIYPGVAAADPIAELQSNRRMLYAGDLDGNVVARLVAVAAAMQSGDLGEFRLTVACRPKADNDASHRERLRLALAPLEASGRATLLGEVDDMDALMRECSLQLFVADHVRRKVDLPLVLLEGLARGLPAVVMDVAPVTEIFTLARRRGLEPGLAVRDDGDAAGLVAALRELCGDEARLAACARDARTLVASEFSLSTMASLHDDMYRDLE